MSTLKEQIEAVEQTLDQPLRMDNSDALRDALATLRRLEDTPENVERVRLATGAAVPGETVLISDATARAILRAIIEGKP